MTIQIDNIRRVRDYEEPNGSFATDASGTMASFKDSPFDESSISMTLDEPTESPMHAQQHIDGYPEEVIMPRRATLSRKLYLEAQTTRPSTGVTAGQGSLGRLLKSVMGAETLQVGTTINDAASTFTGFTVASAAGLSKGGAIALATGTGGRIEVREIKNIATNFVTLKHALSAAPANGSPVWAAATYTMSTGDGDVATSIQTAIEGLEQDDRFLLLGGQCPSGITIEAANGARPSATFAHTYASWFYANGTNTVATLTGSALGTATYTHNQPLVIKDSELRVLTVGTTSLSATLMPASSFEFTPSIAWKMIPAPGGINNTMQWVRDRSAPIVSGSFTIPYENQTWFTAKTNKTDHCITLQVGSSATEGAVMIVAPCCQITDVQLVSVDNIRSVKVSWKGRLDTDVTSITTDVHRSAFRIHIV